MVAQFSPSKPHCPKCGATPSGWCQVPNPPSRIRPNRQIVISSYLGLLQPHKPKPANHIPRIRPNPGLAEYLLGDLALRTMKSFLHEQKTKLSQDEFVKIVGLLPRRSRPWRVALAVVVGVACLFWTYSLILGIALLAAAAISLFAPYLLPAGAAATYRESPHLHQELTYGVGDQELSVVGADLRCRCGWPNLRVWQERDSWLILSPNGMPQLFLSVRQLKDSGVYDDVLALARKHGTEYDRPVA